MTVLNDLVKSFPKLYKRSTDGTIQEWEIKVWLINRVPTIITKFGKIGDKIQEKREEILNGNEIETNTERYAMRLGESRWNEQLNDGYVKNIDETICVNA